MNGQWGEFGDQDQVREMLGGQGVADLAWISCHGVDLAIFQKNIRGGLEVLEEAASEAATRLTSSQVFKRAEISRARSFG